ncbi:MAG: PTS sugar transporter subunit IIC [Desulfovermiculus sp.]|nr:PTS sugar transporter subunit IIC [Desulfovermiculus sp.]
MGIYFALLSAAAKRAKSQKLFVLNRKKAFNAPSYRNVAGIADLEFFFGLITQFRTSINIGFFDRPLTVGLLAGLMTGQWTQCLGAAIFFELLWLDLFPAGTYIPPQRILSTLLVCSTACALNLTTPYQLLLPILCALPAAHLGTFVEKRLRQGQTDNHAQLMTWTDSLQPVAFPGQMIWMSLGKKILCESGLFLLLVMLVTLFTAAGAFFLPGRISWQFDWTHIWAAALLGGILSVRIRRAYYLLIVGGGLVTLLFLL